ncbi:MAG TPA: hypothetical protein VKA38_01870 [Draconibacterium sp.]|nr:hypothetical protein [Draconibacterium sp.]
MSKENYVSGQAGYSKSPPLSILQKPSEKVDVHLNQNKLYFDGKFCKSEDLKSTVEKYLAENPNLKMVRLILQQSDNLSSDIVAKAKEELNKIKNVKIKVMFVEVMDIKEKTPPPPPPTEIYLKNNGEIVVEKNTYKIFSEFQDKLYELKSTLDSINKNYGTQYVYKSITSAGDNVSMSEVDRVIKALRKANFTCY